MVTPRSSVTYLEGNKRESCHGFYLFRDVDVVGSLKFASALDIGDTTAAPAVFGPESIPASSPSGSDSNRSG